jgi:TonB family protein
VRALVLLAFACLDTHLIRAVIRRQLPPVRACYARALAREAPGFGGRLVLKFVIGPLGTVTEAEVTDSELPSEAFETCVTGAVKRWRFPKPPGGGTISVRYPIVFKTAD